MKYNEFTKKLLKQEIGTTITLKKDNGDTIGTFIRVPSGWVYKYMTRHMVSCCFIPYTDKLKYYDAEMYLKPCFNCDSENVSLHSNDFETKFFVQCDECKAHSGYRKDKDETIELWNIKN